jgi:hypothetical protein
MLAFVPLDLTLVLSYLPQQPKEAAASEWAREPAAAAAAAANFHNYVSLNRQPTAAGRTAQGRKRKRERERERERERAA